VRLISSSSERLSTSEKKDLGAFYTPPEMTEFIARWAIRDSGAAVLDPGCGDAAFLVSAATQLVELGARSVGISSQIHGIDLNADAIATARETLAQIGVREPQLQQGNFFTFRSKWGASSLPAVDVIMGNPPYVRYQLFREDNRAAGLKAAAAAGVILPQLASSWAPYVVHASSFLKPSGRMGLVLPGELLHVGYAGAVRDFLLKNFSELTLVTFEEKVFPGALEEVVIVLGVKGAGEGRLRVRRLNSLADLQGSPDVVLADARVCELQPGQRWLTAILEEATVTDALDVLARAQFQRLGELGRVDIGVVTGANDFFVVTKADVESHGFPEGVLLPAISKAAHVQGTRFTGRDWDLLTGKGEPGYLLLLEEGDATGSVAEYLQTGVERKLHERYKCRTRTPWYRVPYVRKPHLFLTYMAHIAPRLVVNEARATHTNTVHGVILVNPVLAEPLAAAFLNSGTLLSAEIEGRSYGGGVLKLEPGEAVKVLVPKFTPKLIEALHQQLPCLDSLVREGRVDEASVIVDRLILGKNFRVAEIEKIRSVLHSLRARRMTRGKTS
jgi:adenine-specific DNA-methyltransferase